MSEYHALPSLAKIAETLGGEVQGFDVLAPGPGHSSVDRSMSVRPDTGAPDGFIVHSFCGDDPIACKKYVCEKLGIKPKGNGKANGVWGKLISEHVYRTEAGDPYLRIQKFCDNNGKKQFPQAHWDGAKWIKGKPAGPKVPYRLPDLVKAGPATPIYFCEGEKSVDRLTQLGFTATCVSEGAQARWPSEVAHWFKNRNVIVLPDNDVVGGKHARKVAKGLRGIAASVRILDLAPHWPGDGMPKGHDVWDWIEKHDTAGARLAQLAKEAPLSEFSAAKADGGVATDGAGLLAEIHSFLGRFVAYPSDQAHIAHTLWIAHAHAMEAWDSTPRIAFLSPEPSSGKTRALEVSELLVPNPVEAVNVSVAYLFRKVGSDEGAPTILYDEIDCVFGPKAKKDNEEIRGLLNAGHRRGAVAGRCVVHGKTVEPQEIPAYCAVALAGIGWLPDTLMSRSIVIRMRRRSPNETIEPYRRRDQIEEGHELRDRLTGWAAAKSKILYASRPAMPVGIEDRNADVWEALFAIADAAGGDWPATARTAAVALVAAGREEEPSLGIRLLADLRIVFAKHEALSTKSILTSLCAMEEAPWGDMRGKPLDARGLALRLRQYGVKRKQIRQNDVTLKGYAKADLHDAWLRYLPASSAERETWETGETTPDSSDLDVSHASQEAENVSHGDGSKSPDRSSTVSDVSHVSPSAGNGGEAASTRLCDHCGLRGATGQYDWLGRPDGIWLHTRCEEPWFESEVRAAPR
jgi:Protein of unknown function (DUF3631)